MYIDLLTTWNNNRWEREGYSIGYCFNLNKFAFIEKKNAILDGFLENLKSAATITCWIKYKIILVLNDIWTKSTGDMHR